MNAKEILSKSNDGKSLVLQTRKGTQIENHQGYEISSFFRNQFKDMKKFNNSGNIIHERTDASAIYNCHGLTFASRRTCIEDDRELIKIRIEDGYNVFKIFEAIPGDILVYFDGLNKIQHTAIVIETAKMGTGNYPTKVLSKWGNYKEVVHNFQGDPYQSICNRFEIWRIKE